MGNEGSTGSILSRKHSLVLTTSQVIVVMVVVVAEMRVEDDKVTFSLFITVYKAPSYSLFYLLI